ncbi:hypothetical protein HK105_201331 [Polyrhizophydium stewartii]|uniref:Ankyrin repeat protein n=1 Tax=Polyrhizophydium stewartii TaxID=2732419 RepID=A0ABR4NHT2_9FUNG
MMRLEPQAPGVSSSFASLFFSKQDCSGDPFVGRINRLHPKCSPYSLGFIKSQFTTASTPKLYHADAACSASPKDFFDAPYLPADVAGGSASCNSSVMNSEILTSVAQHAGIAQHRTRQAKQQRSQGRAAFCRPNEWDRMPGEVQCMILDAAGPFTKFVNGLLVKADLQGLPRHHHERVWQDAIDADWQGDFNAASAAIQEGAIDLLKNFIDSELVSPSDWLVQRAATVGRCDAIELLHTRMPDQQWSFNVGYYASFSGSLELVAWLKEHRPECLDATAFDGAAWGNRAHVVQWLADNCSFGCTSKALEGAAVSDNFEMLLFLHERFPDALEDAGRSFVSSDVRVLAWLDGLDLVNHDRALERALQHGKTDALEWLMARFQLELTERLLLHAYDHRQTALLKFVYERGVPFTTESADMAARSCNVDIMRWLVARDRGLMPMLVDSTAKCGHWMLVEWWRVRYGVVFGQRELEAAICELNKDLVKVLLAMNDVKKLDAVAAAVEDVAGRDAQSI